MKDDVFKGKEIDALLRTAAHLQEEENSKQDKGVGLTLKEVEEIAAESGIDPKFVRQAALVGGLESDDDDRFHFWGGPITLRKSFVINRALSKSEMEELVHVFRRVKDSGGRTDSLGKSLTWSSSERNNQASTVVTMQTQNDSTVCTLKSPVMMPGFLVHYIPMILAFMISLPFVAKEEFSATAVSIMMAMFATIFLITRFAYGKLADKKREELREIESAIKQAGMEPGETEGQSQQSGEPTTRSATTSEQSGDAADESPRIDFEDDAYTGPNDGKARLDRERFRE